MTTVDDDLQPYADLAEVLGVSLVEAKARFWVWFDGERLTGPHRPRITSAMRATATAIAERSLERKT